MLPPARVPQLERGYSGADRRDIRALDTEDGMRALADRLLTGFRSVAAHQGPLLAGALKVESDRIREACASAYAESRSNG